MLSLHRRNQKCIQNFSEKPEGKIPLGRPRRRWDDKIKFGLKEAKWVWGCEMESSDSGWGSLAGSCEKGNESLGSIKDGEFLD
jgi:hypothetical protein